jgi:hypothetical protein
MVSIQGHFVNSVDDMPPASLITLPPTLLDLLSNDLILSQTLPCLPLSSINALIRTSHDVRQLLSTNPLTFRLLDLSRSKSAYLQPSLCAPVDPGGQSFRSERMDENLTEDEFYCGQLRGVFSRLSQFGILRNVHVLVLDGLASVTADLVNDICTRDTFDVWLLSVVGCINLNHRKLQGLLTYLCRESRPVDEPRLKGLYVFGARPGMDPSGRYSRASVPMLNAITRIGGAMLGSAPVDVHSVSRRENDSDLWYAPTGKVLSEGYAQRTSWEETMQVCRGIIAFDAVLCTHMHDDMAPYLHEASKDYLSQHKPAIRPMASVALGPEGCSGCGRAPAGSPVWGETDCLEFPMLRPPPSTGRVVDAVRPPRLTGSQRRLIASCTWCLANRHCESCHRWWCGNCYDPRRRSAKPKDLGKPSTADLDYLPSRQEMAFTVGDSTQKQGAGIKVFNNLCVENCFVGEMMSGAGSGSMW